VNVRRVAVSSTDWLDVCVPSWNLLNETGLAMKLDPSVIAVDDERVASHKTDGESDCAFECAGEWNHIAVISISKAQRTLPNRSRQIRYRWSGSSAANRHHRHHQPPSSSNEKKISYGHWDCDRTTEKVS
jgi:hypothetical protein